jgi:hypothetical protein
MPSLLRSRGAGRASHGLVDSGPAAPAAGTGAGKPSSGNGGCPDRLAVTI